MIWFTETEAERVSKYAQRELNILYRQLEQADKRVILTAIVTGWAAFILGFGAGIWFVLYKLGWQ